MNLRESLHYRTLCLWIADQDLMITHFNIATIGPNVAKGFCILANEARREEWG